jgi:hypothetical protein
MDTTLATETMRDGPAQMYYSRTMVKNQGTLDQLLPLVDLHGLSNYICGEIFRLSKPLVHGIKSGLGRLPYHPAPTYFSLSGGASGTRHYASR